MEKNNKATFIDLGLIGYDDASNRQLRLFEDILSVKSQNRNVPGQAAETPNYVLFCEHPHVYTLGKSGDVGNLLIKEEALAAIGASFFHINRGGDITYHGPGQIVGYPILDLENFFTDIHRYMRSLEEAVIRTLAVFGLPAGRVPGLTGVWIEPDNDKAARKVCALGVKTSRWVTMHGFAFNVNTDLNYFNHIVPCGINDKAVTSMERELGAKQNMAEVRTVLKEKIAEQFGIEWI